MTMDYHVDIWFNKGLAHVASDHRTLASARKCVAVHMRMGGVDIFEIINPQGEVVESWDRDEGQPSPIAALVDAEVLGC
jgi:hypothetical protein